jgi:hypothetical protein
MYCTKLRMLDTKKYATSCRTGLWSSKGGKIGLRTIHKTRYTRSRLHAHWQGADRRSSLGSSSWMAWPPQGSAPAWRRWTQQSLARRRQGWSPGSPALVEVGNAGQARDVWREARLDLPGLQLIGLNHLWFFISSLPLGPLVGFFVQQLNWSD